MKNRLTLAILLFSLPLYMSCGNRITIDSSNKSGREPDFNYSDTNDKYDTGIHKKGCKEYGEPVIKSYLPDGLNEISGIAMSSIPSVMWMHNDSGAKPLLYAVDINTGKFMATIKLDVDLAYDWEDMSAGPCPDNIYARCLFIGDIGDGGMRESLGILPRIHLISEPDPAIGDQTISDVKTMIISYSDGKYHNAEALVTDKNGRVFILTKEEGNIFYLFGASFKKSERPVRLTNYGRFDISSVHNGSAVKVTGADYSVEENRLIVRDWAGIIEYILPYGHDLTNLAGIEPRLVPSAQEVQGQGETVVYGDGGYYHISEGNNMPIYYIPCRARE